MVILNGICMQIRQFWVQIVLSCHIWGRSVRFHPTHQSTKLSKTFLLSRELWFGRTVWMVQPIYWFSMSPYGWATSWTIHWSTPISSRLTVLVSRTTLSTPSLFLSPPMMFSVELYLEGTIICGDTRTPTESELGQLPRLILTSPHNWDPHNVCFPSCSGQSSDNTPIESSHSILAVDMLLQHTIYDPIMVASLMASQVQVAEIAMPSAVQDVPLARTFQLKEGHSTVTPSDLSERWYIGLGQATQTLKVTTQRLMHSAILPLAW